MMKMIVPSVAAMLGLWAANVSAQTPPPGPNPTPVQANVTLTVDTSATTGVTAKAQVEFLDYYAVRSQAAPWRDSAGRFMLDATVEPVAVIMIYPPPPKPVRDLTYQLGVLPAGGYTAVFRMNGKVFAEKTFTVAAPPPKPPVQVTLQVASTATGSVAKARVVFPDGYWVLSDPGVPQRTGSQFSINAKADQIQTLVKPSGPNIFEPQYPLGLLPAGSYSITYRVNGVVAGVFPFTVVAPQPVPQLSFINFRQGDVSTAAEVGVTVPSGITVTSWGEVARDGSSFKVALTFGASALTDPTTASVGLLRHTYSLGVVEAGAYRMAVSDAGTGRVLGTREFKVGPPLPPPPPPAPIVAYLQPGQDATGWFVEIGLAFPRPGLEVKDWGTPTREGNVFRTAITSGPAVAPVTAFDSTIGGVPVNCGPSVPAGEPPTVVDPAVSEPFREIGGWPSRLVRHRYPLGALTPGEYDFVVVLGGQEVAKRAFVVPAPVTPGPVATLVAPPLTTATVDPYSFRIAFNAAGGWDGEPGKGKVTVTGPNGFSGVAELVSTIPSMDPLGRLFDCTYALTGPGSAWDAADNGAYRVWIDPKAVLDRNGRTVPRPCIGAFPVQIRPVVPPPPPALQAEVVVEMRDGRWFADVAFENTGGWFAADWGQVRVNGNVFAALAALRPLPPGSMAPILSEFGHSYPLGSPPPGTYTIVFKSNAGHCATATFVVPGVEPAAALDGWAITTGTRATTGSDDDGDGWSNRAEFYLGMQPQAADQPTVREKVLNRDGRRHFALEFRRVNGVEAPVTMVVEVSRDLSTWTEAGDLVEWIPGTPDPDGTEAVEVVQRVPLDGNEWPFMRLRVEELPTP
jgi:hypothetical protein